MKTIIAGSRSIKNYHLVERIIQYSCLANTITEVVSGTAEGVDQLGEEYAIKHGIWLRQFPCEWERYGMRGATKRDSAMVNYADQLIAIWDGKSTGTKRTIDFAKERNLRMYVYTVSDYELNMK